MELQRKHNLSSATEIKAKPTITKSHREISHLKITNTTFFRHIPKYLFYTVQKR